MRAGDVYEAARFFRVGDGRMRGGRECRTAFAPGTRIVFRMKEGKGEKNKSNHPEREINERNKYGTVPKISDRKS